MNPHEALEHAKLVRKLQEQDNIKKMADGARSSKSYSSSSSETQPGINWGVGIFFILLIVVSLIIGLSNGIDFGFPELMWFGFIGVGFLMWLSDATGSSTHS